MINQNETEIAAVFKVAKLDRSLAFYSDVLGLKVERHDDGHGDAYGMGRIGGVWFIFFEEPVSEAPGGLSADFLDPDGHVLSLYQKSAA